MRFVLILLLAVLTVSAQDFIPYPEYQTKEYRAKIKKEKIKQLLVKQLVTNSKFADEKDMIETLIDFDPEGKVTKIVYKNFAARENELYTYTYKGDLLSESVYKQSPGLELAADPEIHQISRFTYDAKGNPTQIEKTDHTPNGVFISWIVKYNYDKKGKLVTIVDSLMPEPGIEPHDIKDVYFYDKNGRLFKKTTGLGEVQYVYDKKGRLTKKHTVSTAIEETTLFTYDAKGNVAKEDYKSSYTNTLSEYKYSDSGLKMQEKVVTTTPDGTAPEYYLVTYTYMTK